jgi:hypothetical protein
MRLPLCWLCLLLLAAPLAAQEKKEAKKPQPPKDKNKYAVTSAAEAGPDYWLQGEYGGAAGVPGWGYRSVGLQIVALGEGRFDAVLYRGGLPGAGWDRGEKRKLSGEAAGAGAVVFGDGQSITLYGGRATLYSPAGQALGSLARIERTSPTMGLAPPAGATILFDGHTTDNLQGAKVTPDGLLLAGVLTKMPVEDFRLHLEFRTPYMPFARGQARGNSGVYIQQRYEVQILDSFGLEGVENECGGLYRQTRPDLNMALPPLAWQTYDIWFTAARFAEDGKTRTTPARITVLHNGVAIHSNRAIANKTGGGKQEGPQAFPINLQDHGNPVAFRNVWLVPGQGSVAPAVLPSNYCQPACCTPCQPVSRCR